MNRREFLKWGSAVLGCSALPVMKAWGDDLRQIRRMVVSMGTMVSFDVYSEDERLAIEAIGRAATAIQEVHRALSVQEVGSELWRWNESSRGSDVPFSELAAAAVTEALAFVSLTEGRLDPAVGAAVRSYETGSMVLPIQDRTCEWDAANRILRKPHASVRLDLGGTAKGWAVDRAIDVLQRHGIENALVNAGGDLRCIGTPPGHDAWPVGLRDPRLPDDLFTVVQLRDAAIATSGDYELNGSTLVDPRDLARVRPDGSFSIVAPTCGAADCLATAISIDPGAFPLPSDHYAIVARKINGELAITADSALHINP